MSEWSSDELEQIAGADGLRIAPVREDGATLGTPTWIWSVAVDSGLYVRAYHGQNSRWYQAAARFGVGTIEAMGITWDVGLIPVAGLINKQVDAAYRQKYRGSPYLHAMTGNRAQSATVRVFPRADLH